VEGSFLEQVELVEKAGEDRIGEVGSQEMKAVGEMIGLVWVLVPFKQEMV